MKSKMKIEARRNGDNEKNETYCPFLLVFCQYRDKGGALFYKEILYRGN